MNLIHQELTQKIRAAIIEVHRNLGPGLLEKTYEFCLCKELEARNIPYRSQLSLPIEYKGTKLDDAYRIDLIVDEKVIIELKAVETLTSVHKAQLLTYLKLTGLKVGLLVNFNVERVVDGIERLVN